MITDVFIRPKSKSRDLTDDELMVHVRRGDDDAFRMLYDRYKSQIFLYCLRMVNDRDAAKDVLQDIFIRIHANKEKYEPGTNFNGWIHTIARNLCLNARRNIKSHASFDEAMVYNDNPAAINSDVALREKLAEEIADLPEIYREALVLREYEGHSYQEIAEIAGVAMSSVKFRIFKAREMLRGRLADWLDEAHGANNRINNQPNDRDSSKR